MIRQFASTKGAFFPRMTALLCVILLLLPFVLAKSQLTKEEVIQWIEENVPGESATQSPLTGFAPASPQGEERFGQLIFTANDQKDFLVIGKGEYISYYWDAPGAKSLESSFEVLYPDGCGNLPDGNFHPWSITTASGMSGYLNTKALSDCQVGGLYIITLRAYADTELNDLIDIRSIWIRVRGLDDVAQTITCQFKGLNSPFPHYCELDRSKMGVDYFKLYSDDLDGGWCSPDEGSSQCSFKIKGNRNTPLYFASSCGKLQGPHLDGISDSPASTISFSCPSATLFAKSPYPENTRTKLDTFPGEEITYNWNTQYADKTFSFLFSYTPDCGTSPTQIERFLSENPFKGQASETIQPCGEEVSHSYATLYIVSRVEGEDTFFGIAEPLFVNVLDPSKKVKASLTTTSGKFLIAKTSDPITYRWESSGADTFNSYIVADKRNNCGISIDPDNPTSWKIDNKQGESTFEVKECMAGLTLYITYEAINTHIICFWCKDNVATDSILIKVLENNPSPALPASRTVHLSTASYSRQTSAAQSPSPSSTPAPASQQPDVASSAAQPIVASATDPSAVITVSYGQSTGQKDITVPVGAQITYTWSTANADTAQTRVTRIQQDSCDAQIYYWNSNNLLGTKPFTVSSCMAGGAYEVSTWAYKGQSSETDKVTVRVSSTDPNAPFGSFDSADCNTLSGWACDKDALNQPISLHLYKGGSAGTGQFVDTIVANFQREAAVGTACGDNGAHGFSFQVPQSLKNGQAQTLYLHAINTPAGSNNPLISGSGKSITCQSTPSTPSDPIGFFELANCEVLRGWACDKDALNQPISLHLYKGGPAGTGQFVDTILANFQREAAVGTACGDNGAHGFSFQVPQSLKNGQPQTLYIHALNFPASSNNPLISANGKSITCGTTASTSTPTYRSVGSSSESTLGVKNLGTGDVTGANKDYIEVSPGQEIEFAWSSTTGSSFNNMISSDKEGSCVLNLYSNGRAGRDTITAGQTLAWPDTGTPSGSKRYMVQNCDSGITYTFKYNAIYGNNNLNTDTVTIRVSGSNSGTNPTTTYLYVKNVNTNQAANSITANVGEEIEFKWGTPNSRIEPVITSTLGSCRFAQGDNLGANTQTFWNDLNSARGTKKFRVLPCDAGATYTITYRVYSGTNELLDNPTVTVVVPAQVVSSPHDPIGNFDLANCETISGWACDSDALNSPISLHLYKGGSAGTGQFVESILANQQREAAVGTACGDNGAHGFSFPTPQSLKNGQAQTLYIHALNSPASNNNPLISGSGKTITCAASSTTSLISQLQWSPSGAIAGKRCTQITENLEPAAHTWNDNYLCTTDDFGAQWSMSGPIAGKNCVNFNEPADPHSWNDNYYCTTQNHNLYFSSNGQVSGKTCIRINEDADPHTWNDNYLCDGAPTSSAAPTAWVHAVTLRNSQPVDTTDGDGMVNAIFGDQIRYTWGSTNGVSQSSTFTQNRDACGISATSVNQPWMISTSSGFSGSRVDTVGQCQAGTDYTIRYLVNGQGGTSASSSLVVKIGSAPQTGTTTATLRAVALRNGNQIDTTDGDGTLRVGVGDRIQYTWASANADSARAEFTINSADTCGNPVGPNPWGTVNSLSGSARLNGNNNNDNILACQAGRSYTITYFVRNGQNPEVSSSIQVIVGTPPTALLQAANTRINSGLLLSSISAKPGDTIRYVWSSSNADQFSSTYSVNGVGSYPWGVAANAQGSDPTGVIDPSQAGKNYAITYKARNSQTGEEALSSVYINVEAFQKLECVNNVCFGAHSYVFPIKNGYGTYQPYPFFCRGGFTIDTRDGKYESTCETVWQVQSGCTTPDGYTFPNCPAGAPTSRTNAQCVNKYCKGYNSRVDRVENADGRGAGNPPVVCDGAWEIDTRGSTYTSSCKGGANWVSA